MCSTDPIVLDDLPEPVLQRYSNDSVDKFMITIYPSAQLYTDTDVLYRFVDATERVSQNTTGGPSVSVAWMRISARDGRNAIMLTLVIVFILLWIDFRRPWFALMAMIPLALGAFWMVGIMQLSGMMMNFMTLMGVPLIIGIGIDDGVHIMHRWKYEGAKKLKTIFSSTGKSGSADISYHYAGIWFYDIFGLPGLGMVWRFFVYRCRCLLFNNGNYFTWNYRMDREKTINNHLFAGMNKY